MTRNLRWIKLESGIDLLDAPGVIPPNLEDQKSALNLALCDDIGEAAYEIESVAIGFIKIISTLNKDKNANISVKQISNRYGVDIAKGFKNPSAWIEKQLQNILQAIKGECLISYWKIIEIKCWVKLL